jgi:threonyl-tRNA synthetase
MEVISMSEKYQESALYRLRHSAAHVMAQAVLEKFPEGQIAIGPPIADGFYYDFELPRPLTPEDLEELEARMREIVAEEHPFEYQEVDEEQARQIFEDQVYKQELIDGLVSGSEDEYGEQVEGPVKLSIYRHGAFVDLCRGPHVKSTQQINPDGIKLLNVAGAYWRGDENKPMLQRIYGTAWETAEELEQYLWRLEEAKRRDHRRLGRELDLYSISDEVGAGLILWHPKGARVRLIAEQFSQQAHLEAGYEWVFSPHIGKADLWQRSGHLDFYQDSMYAPMDIEGQAYYAKPMNCPFHIQIYKSHTRSYRDLPLRYAELGTVYRYERSGVLHGLMRVRGFTQDDAHHFVPPELMPEEIDFAVDFSLYILRSFGFEDFQAYLSTRPEKYVGDDAQWEAATEALRAALERAKLPYEIDEGGGVFYGPKIDIKLTDALAREWQCSTIQFDFNLPERFDLEYVGQDGETHRPYMIHRALMGSVERFFGVLVEHYAGAFPVWLAPVQVVLIPIADRHMAYCQSVRKQLTAAGLRVEVDGSSDRMGNKIRKAQEQKVPYMLIVGDREVENAQVAVRLRSGEDLKGRSVDEFIEIAQKAVAEKAK